MKSRDGDRDPGKPSSAPGLRWTRRGGLLELFRKALDGNSNGQAKPEAPLTISRKNSEVATEGESNPPGGEIVSGRLYKRARYRHKCVESDGNSSRKRSVQQDSVPKVTTPSGLENLGNTCYLNAILQCLRSTNLVRDYCCSIEPICPKCSKLNSDLFPAFVYLITKMDSITNGSVGSSTISKFKNAFAKFVPSYGGNLQQDALEFFTYLMDGLHEEIKERPLTPTHSGVNYVRSVSIGSSLPPTIPPSKRKLSHKPQMGGLKVSESSHQLTTADTGELGDRTKPPTRKWSRPWLQRSRAPSAGHVNNFRCGGYICQLALGSAETTAGGKSFLKDTFVGHLQTQLRCLQCNNVNTRDELFWNLALCVPEANKEETRKGASPSSPAEASPPDDTGVSLDDCLRAFTKPEILDDLDKPFCGKCKTPTKAQLQVMISRLPKILVLQFQRFDSTCCKTKKRHLIKFDFQQDMAPYYVKDSPGEETLSSAEKTPEIDSPQTVNTSGTDSLPPPRSSLTSSTSTIDVTGPVVSTNYRLYAVVFHQGGTERGHYTARCLLPSPQPAWFLFDDENVSPIADPHDVIQPTAYILFYERVDAQDNDVSTSSTIQAEASSPSSSSTLSAEQSSNEIYI